MKKVAFIFLSLLLGLSSCIIDGDITSALPPTIVLDSETGIYIVKTGRELCIAPTYENAEGASFTWRMDGQTISKETSLTFMREEVGEYYIVLTVSTDAGSDSEEIRVDVVEKEIPTVSIAGAEKLLLAEGQKTELNATVRKTSLETSIEWSVNGKWVSEELIYTFHADALGKYTVVCHAENEDGAHSDSVLIDVVRAEDMPLVWEFEQHAYHTVVGRKLRIKPTQPSKSDDVVYSWQVDNNAPEEGDDSFVFTATKEGKYSLKATANAERDGQQISITHEWKITVYPEGAYYRAKNASSKADWNKVYEYTPAPGQFINETKTGGFDGSQTTPEAAIAYAEARMGEVDKNGNPYPNWVSLGGFGGYIVVGFDHSIDNSGDYDLGILGNSFSGSSEPGIVWVMQDENGNGLPDDTWYELAGSETGKAETIQDYAVTYYRPTGSQMPVQWKDNMGNSGEIDYLKQFHRQDYYYPLWIEADSYTLTGTCLNARNYDASGNSSYWVNDAYDWGYADNFSPIDRLTSEDNAAAGAIANHFKIAHAIDFEGKSVDLKYIDFVKVQVGVNAKSGWLGEVSTEVFGFYDYRLKSLTPSLP